jgi:uncharacterized protein (DUF1800 family)
LCLGLCLSLWGCGGGGEAGGAGLAASPPTTGGASPLAPAADLPASRAEAAGFLAQATFGPTGEDIDRVMRLGYSAWIDEQLALPPSAHRAAWEQAEQEIRRLSPTASAGGNEVLNAFWQHAATAPDQLRQRWAWALSQTFVVSMVDRGVGNQPRAAAAWMDMLATQGTGRYRPFLEQVTLHPLMGVYLSHLRNQKADARSGRVPDENFAREVLQLFSVGLVELGADGQPRLVNGQPVELATPDDISGLARVFTGFSWDCPAWPSNNCFRRGSDNGLSDPDQWIKPMRGYSAFHSTEEKRFLNTVIAPQAAPDPEASLRAALDGIAAHPNVGPFIGRQMIQRLVTSNPSPAYVRAVAQAFDGSGGDLSAMLKAILLHPEARQRGAKQGRVREPVLRLAAYLRAFPHRSDTGRWRVGNTDKPATALGQSPLRSPSVFNFYRPGYAAPGSAMAAAGLVAPELQIQHETSAAGYVNFMRGAVGSGLGQRNGTVDGVALNRPDLQRDWAPEIALADDPSALVQHVLQRLLPAGAPASLQDILVEAVASVSLPALTATNSNQVNSARRNRVNVAVLLALVSPEFQVQP